MPTADVTRGPRATVARVLAVVGTVLVVFPLAAPIGLAVVVLFAAGGFHFDFLMPGELVLVVIAGGVILFASTLISRRHRLRTGLLVATVGLLFAITGVLSVATGLASGDSAAEGWRLGLVIGAYVLYVVSIIALFVAGVDLCRSVPAAGRHQPVYALAVGIGRVLFGGLLRLKPIVSGADHVPHTGGAVLASTHFGYLDFALLEWVVWLRTRRRIRFLATQGAFDKPVVGWLLRSMGHIPVNMKAGSEAYARAVGALRSGELLGIFPEAGVSASFTVRELKTGAARMAAEAGVPILPVVLWGGQLLRTKNHRARLREAFRAPILVDIGSPTMVGADEDPVVVTQRLRASLQAMLDEVQAAYPRSGEGQWWQPAHLGGSAPTPEVAAIAELERQRLKEAAHG